MHRLLVLTSTFPATPGDGVPAFVLDLAREQSRRFAVTVLAPRVQGAPRRESVHGVEVERFAYFPRRWEDLADGAILDNLKERPSRFVQVPFFLIAQLAAISRLHRRHRFDAIHAHWVIPQGLAARLAAPRVPLVLTTHGGDLYALNGPPVGALKRWLLRRAERVATVNADMAERLRGWRVNPDSLSVLPMGVPLEAAGSVEGHREPGRILVVGRLVEKKGFAILIDALRRHVPDREWEATVVGDGPLRGQLERQARGWRVHFAGQQSRESVLTQLATCSIFVLPSVRAESGDQEGLPVALLEAAAMGCPIVASDLPGINEALTDGVTALLVPPGDAEALGAAVQRLLADAQLRARLGAAARERSRDFSVERIGAAYSDLVDQAIAISAESRRAKDGNRQRAADSPQHS
jgi:glycosyltransferase involved in cell wall biosynthesis